jgi:small ligand-binding sensory domain FIST
VGVKARSGLGLGDDWRAALAQALEPLAGTQPDLLVLFASADYQEDYSALLRDAKQGTGATCVVGCSASAVIANAREVEDAPGVAALGLELPPAANVEVIAISPSGVTNQRRFVHTPTGFLVLVDPFTADAAALVARLERDYPGVPIMGGLATGDPRVGETFIFNDTEVMSEGALVVALSGPVTLRPVVSQGCEPIGQTWTITNAEHNVIHSIGGRPAYTVLVETVQALDTERRERVNNNLLVGLAMDEYRDEFKRGDFLIRNLIGVDRASGAIAIAAEVDVGQTIQFQIRDARAADDELRTMLGSVKDQSSAAALLFACNGRGVGLFGGPDHDARTVDQLLGPLPLAGLFCNGEIGPVGSHTFVHGFTASLALIAPLE